MLVTTDYSILLGEIQSTSARKGRGLAKSGKFSPLFTKHRLLFSSFQTDNVFYVMKRRI